MPTEPAHPTGDPSKGQAEPTTVSVLTFNAGLLDAFWGRLCPVPYVEERLFGQASALQACGADVILLQEVYQTAHQRALAGALRSTHPFGSSPERPRGLELGSGLLIFSRFPVEARLHVFRNLAVEERLFARKGTLVATVMLPGGNNLRVLNTHTTAGGAFRHPESPAADSIRDAQIEEICGHLPSAVTTILAGDFNAGPSVSPGNYCALLLAGLVDTWASLHGEERPTWDPANVLNRRGPHRHCPAQRIDHVFLRKADSAAGVRVVSSEMMLSEPIVPLADGQRVTLSDHYAVRSTFQLPD